jgi:large subunit ribosomal protein L3
MSNSLGIIGKKVGMTRIFAEDGSVIPVTVVKAGPCPIIQKKSQDKEGYNAIQLAFEKVPGHRLNKPEQGHLKKAESGYFKHLKEFKVENIDQYELGQDITVEIFQPGEKIKVTGTSKGKGFAGVMKRWNFGGMPASHGHEKVHRSSGSIGQCAWPSKVFKGKKMAGQMGNRKVTYVNAEIVDIRPEDNLVLIKGQVPGPKHGFVILRKKS